MKTTKNQLFSQVEKIARKVKEDLKSKGYIVPVREKNGDINFEGVRVKKIGNFFTIYNKSNSPIYERINLIQTAVLTANSVALGKFADLRLIEADRQYGYQQFENEIYTHRIDKSVPDSDDWVFYDTKRKIIQQRVSHHKKIIEQSYKKLTSLR